MRLADCAMHLVPPLNALTAGSSTARTSVKPSRASVIRSPSELGTTVRRARRPHAAALALDGTSVSPSEASTWLPRDVPMFTVHTRERRHEWVTPAGGGMPVVPVIVENMLVHGVALLLDRHVRAKSGLKCRRNPSRHERDASRYSGKQASHDVDNEPDDYRAEEIGDESVAQCSTPHGFGGQIGVGHLERHADRKGQVGEVPVVRSSLFIEVDTTIGTPVVDTAISQRKDRVDNAPSEHQAGSTPIVSR